MFFSNKIIGVDIGTAAVKVVEISGRGKSKKLNNYGQMRWGTASNEPAPEENASDLAVLSDMASLAIREILKQAKIKTKQAIFSIADFSTFSTSFEIPPMTEKEIPGAVRYNASQYLTLPISEVTLDWQVISDPIKDNKSPLRVFVVAVPNQVVKDLQAIAKEAGLDLQAIESEVFSITRALAKDNSKTICLLDLGAKSSTLSIVDAGMLKKSYSFNFGGGQLSREISSALSMGYSESEDIKNKEGLNSKREGVAQLLQSSADLLLAQVKNISAEFLKSEQKQVEEIYLTGGVANLPGLREYFAKNIQKPVSVPNCFSGLLYPKILEEKLLQMSPGFSVAVGAALNGLEI